MAITKLLGALWSVACVLPVAESTGALYGLPVLNGPIPLTPQVLGSKSRIGDFVHPGLWHTHDDLERIRLGVEDGVDPWISAYRNFTTNEYSQADVGARSGIKSFSDLTVF